jgi:predicted Zn-dependent protease
MNPHAPIHNLKIFVITVMAFLIWVWLPHSSAGERGSGGGLFDIANDIFNSVIVEPNAGNPRGSDKTIINDLTRAAGEVQEGIVKAVHVPLTDAERRRLGKEVHESIRLKFKGKITRPSRNRDAALMRVWGRLKLSRLDPTFDLYTVETDTINAFAHVGGYIYIHRGLLDEIEFAPDLIAMVLAHEAAHILNRDVDDPFAIEKGAGRLVPNEIGKAISDVILNQLFFGYNQKKEYEADRRGMEILVGAGYSRRRALGLFDHLRDMRGRGNSHDRIIDLLDRHYSTHPPAIDRKRRLAEGS